MWALRRRAHNEVDRFDRDCYRRVLCLAGEPSEVTVRQDPTASTPSVVADLRGHGGYNPGHEFFGYRQSI